MQTTYLDIEELAEMMGISIAAAKRTFRQRAWDLPPRAHGFGKLQRWRRNEVDSWMFERGLNGEIQSRDTETR
jgi:predicted DNA-binding transcriptional regulator AlpA